MLHLRLQGQAGRDEGQACATPDDDATAETMPPECGEVRCAQCRIRHLCVASGLEVGPPDAVNRAVQGWRLVRQGERLYRSGDLFHSLYAIRTGSFKTVVLPERGKEYIAGFYMAGDAIGLDGISQDIYRCDAVALEDSVVCVMPFQALEMLCRETGALQRGLHRIFSAEILRASRQMFVLGSLSAEQRVAAFLLDMAARQRERGYSGTSFVLRMTREDIGSFLGLTLETVSRALSRFQHQQLILVRGKAIQLLDPDGLEMRPRRARHGYGGACPAPRDAGRTRLRGTPSGLPGASQVAFGDSQAGRCVLAMSGSARRSVCAK